MFVSYLLEVPVARYNYTELNSRFLAFELGWQTQGMNGTVQQTVLEQAGGKLQILLEGVVGSSDNVFR